MRRLVYAIGMMLMLSCANHHETEELLDRAWTMMDEQPDSAWVLLDGNSGSHTEWPRRLRMRYKLLKALTMNKTDQSLATDSTMEEVVDYYNAHGNHNERMMANYMMGCVYRDRGDAPVALQYYCDATSAADTISKDCDFKTLSRVYGQIATLFIRQHSPRLAIDAEWNAFNYANKAKDSINAVTFFLHISSAYEMLNIPDSTLYIVEQASKFYHHLGYHELAIRTLPMAIAVYLQHKEYNKAKHAMRLYEEKSGLFNTSIGEVISGRELYYDLKGIYYEGVGEKDSALFYFRKLLQFPNDISNVEAGYRGLLTVYKKLNYSDSIAKYAILFANINDSSNLIGSAEEINRMQALYNYNESQRLAEAKSKEAENYRNAVYTIIFVFIVSLISLYIFFRYLKRKKKERLAAFNSQYAEALAQYNKSKQDLELSNRGHEQYRIEKEKEIENLKQILSIFQEDKLRPEQWDIEQALLASSIVKRFHKLASKALVPSEAEWEDLQNTLSNNLPIFIKTICDLNNRLTEYEIKVCMLVRLRFIPSETVTLMNLTSQRITNIRSSINLKLFNVEGAKTLDSNIRRLG